MSKNMKELGHVLGRDLTQEILGKIFNALVKKSLDNHGMSEPDASHSEAGGNLESWPWGPWHPRPRPYYPSPWGPRPWGPRPWGPRPRPWWTWEKSTKGDEKGHGR